MTTEPMLENYAQAAYVPKEEQLSLSLQSSKLGDVTVIHCRGRIIFRNEAEALSHAVAAALQESKHIILELQGVNAIDSAGMGELVALHMWAQGYGATLKLSGLSSRLLYLLELTNLTTVFEIFPTQEQALNACQAA
ncbi:MAG TPA: STAS domain-containing protein [Terriglobales bacterium]|nr:STAS domain-containing protein [Terriglobales bacterium]